MKSLLNVCISVLILVPTASPAIADIVIDDFQAAVSNITLIPGDAPLQSPAVGSSILGGERDMQSFIGYGPVGETWRTGVDPSRGLYWDADPGMHVNTVLEWDGSGDGSTNFDALPINPLSVDLSALTAFRFEFGFNTKPLSLVMLTGNRADSPTPTGASQTQEYIIPGGQSSPFFFDVAFAEFEAVFSPFLPGTDWSNVNVIVARIGSAPGVEGNAFELRRVTAVPEPSSGLFLLSATVGFGFARRRKFVFVKRM